jgi:hypothetical protein
MKQSTALAKLPLPTGNPWLVSPDDPATVPIPLPVIIVSVEGPYTEQDRKLWTFLLHAVWDELGEKVIHEIPIREITRIFRDLRGRHHTDWIWESAERLADTKVRWIRTENRYKGGHLFGAETEDEVKKGHSAIQFSSPPRPDSQGPRRFAVCMHFLIELSGKYSVTSTSFWNRLRTRKSRNSGSVEELRQWLKMPEGKLLRWRLRAMSGTGCQADQ